MHLSFTTGFEWFLGAFPTLLFVCVFSSYLRCRPQCHGACAHTHEMNICFRTQICMDPACTHHGREVLRCFTASFASLLLRAYARHTTGLPHSTPGAPRGYTHETSSCLRACITDDFACVYVNKRHTARSLSAPSPAKGTPLQYITHKDYPGKQLNFNTHISDNLVNFIIAKFFNQPYMSLDSNRSPARRYEHAHTFFHMYTPICA
jgi:hypothetical protein